MASTFAQAMQPSAPRTLVPSVTCPHCWIDFPPVHLRSISEHESLRGDAVLGDAAPMRFLPSRFDAAGRAIDPMGMPCTRHACPRCHLEIPRVAIEVPQTILSIVGAPASGKSVMLAAASFALRSGLVVPGLDFLDADPSLNDLTLELEGALFRSSTPDRPAAIAKTDLSGRLYRSFRLGDAVWTAPKPQLFTVARGAHRRLLALYDNAGEHFLPGRDAPHEPVTRHLGVSRALVFVVDPTQDHRVASRLGGEASVAAVGGGGGVEQRQDLVLIEAANRIRRLRLLSPSDPLPFRIVLALAKADIWGHLCAPGFLPTEMAADRTSLSMPDAATLRAAHDACVRMLGESMPEFVAAARSLDPGFRAVPFSGLGRHPSRESSADAALAIRPRDVRPVWPAAPLIVALAEAEGALLPEFATP